jgi:hypothetical protein
LNIRVDHFSSGNEDLKAVLKSRPNTSMYSVLQESLWTTHPVNMLGMFQAEMFQGDMLRVLAVLVCLCHACAGSTEPDLVKESRYRLSPSLAGVGEVVDVAGNVTALRCAVRCSVSETCNCATLDPTHDPDKYTCTLLHVAHPEDDWRHSPPTSFMCADAPIDIACK